eukprot:5967058-Amphidinium_carterae.2
MLLCCRVLALAMKCIGGSQCVLIAQLLREPQLPVCFVAMSQQPEEASFWEAMSDAEDSIDAPTLDANTDSLPLSESRD